MVMISLCPLMRGIFFYLSLISVVFENRQCTSSLSLIISIIIGNLELRKTKQLNIMVNYDRYA